MRSALGRSDRRPPRPTDRAALGSPLCLVNLKAYPGALGPGALRFARLLADAGRAAGVAVALAPAAPDLAAVVGATRIPVLAQHVDPGGAGPRTGYVPVPAVRAAGARGSLVNHSEHPLSRTLLRRAVTDLHEAGLSAIVCARDARLAGQLAALRPEYLAVEPPELIGGRRAVSTARPGVVVAAVEAVRAVAPRTRVLCGAGIRGRADVRRALELGSEGVLVASAVALAPDPRSAIDELLAGF